MHRRQLLEYWALAFIWGSSFLLVLQVARAFGVVGAVSFRSLAASVLLLLVARLQGRRLDFRGAWLVMAIVGATTVAGQLLGLAYATQHIGTAMTAIFVGSIPLFSALIGRALGLERLTRWGVVGLLLGFGGIVLLVGFPAAPVTPEFLIGCVAAVFGAVCAAAGSSVARRDLVGVGSWEQSIATFLFGGLLTLPFLVVVPVPSVPQPADLLWLVLLAAVCSSFAYVLYWRLVADVGATIAISVEFLVTCIAVLIGALLLHEPLTPLQAAGGVVIVLGSSLVVGLLPRRRHATAADRGTAPAGGA